jgi:hypothetical protein
MHLATLTLQVAGQSLRYRDSPTRVDLRPVPPSTSPLTQRMQAASLTDGYDLTVAQQQAEYVYVLSQNSIHSQSCYWGVRTPMYAEPAL